MRKVLAFLLALVIGAVALTGCDSDNTIVATRSSMDVGESQYNYEGSHLLPYGLAFGMEYKEADKVCDNFPAIHNANSNNGYDSDSFSPETPDHETFYGIDHEYHLDCDTSYYFSFNESKQLYEFNIISIVYNGEENALHLFHTYDAFFTEKLSTKSVSYLDSINATKMTSEWETDEFTVCVVTELGSGDLMVSVVVHSKTFELGNTNQETKDSSQQQTDATDGQPQQETPAPSINGYSPGVFKNWTYISDWLNIKYQNYYAVCDYAPSWEENKATINNNPDNYRITEIDLGGANADRVLMIEVQKISDSSQTLQELIAKEQAEETAFFNNNPYTPSHTWTEPTEFNLAGETYMTQQVTLHVNYNGQTYDETNWYLYRIKDGHLVIMSGIGQVSSQVQFFSTVNG